MNQAILLESNADNIDFMIHGIFSIKVFGQEVWITTSHACILIVMAIMVIFAIVANRKLKKAKEVPDGFQNIIELIVEMLDKMVEGTMGKWAPRFVNYISTIFIFILMSNISGLFGLRPPTADYGTTLALALITFFMIRFNKAKHQSAHRRNRQYPNAVNSTALPSIDITILVLIVNRLYFRLMSLKSPCHQRIFLL